MRGSPSDTYTRGATYDVTSAPAVHGASAEEVSRREWPKKWEIDFLGFHVCVSRCANYFSIFIFV